MLPWATLQAPEMAELPRRQQLTYAMRAAFDEVAVPRVEAQIAVRSLQHEAAERHKLMEEQKVLYDNVVGRMKAAQQRLRELGGELPWDTPGVPPGLQPEVFGPPGRPRIEASLAEASRPLPPRD